MIGVPVGPGEEDVGDLRQDLLQLVRIYSFPDRRHPGKYKVTFVRIVSDGIDSHFRIAFVTSE